MFNEQINIEESIKKNPFLIFVISLVFATVVAILDSFIDYFWFYKGQTFIEALFPPIYSHEFYMRTMMVLIITLFGLLVTLLMRNNLKYHETINKSEFLFKTVANFTKDWEYWINNEGKLNFISPSCLEITGYSPEEFKENPELIQSLVFDKDENLYWEHENKLSEEKELNPIEFRIKRKDGKIIWIGHTCRSVYDEQGEFLGQRVSNRDISSQKEVEAKLIETSKKLEEQNELLKQQVNLSYIELKAIISQSPYAKAIFDKKGNTIKVNDAWLKLFQESEPLKNIFDFSNDELNKEAKSILKNGGIYKSEPIYFEELDKMLQITLYDIKNLNGETEKLICNYEDVTDQMRRLDSDRELQLQRNVSKRLFQFLEDERKHISKELHDQIGQKLMLIKLNTELLKETFPETKDKAGEIIKLLLSTNKEIKDIIYSLHPAELENYGLVAALDSMINRCGSISNFKASIHVYGEYLPIDKNRELGIYRICQEIVSNIAKHSKATSATFNFHFEEERFIGIISDNGIGFNIQEFRKNKNAPRSFGLISIQERAKNLNGSLEFHSKVGEGTSIYFQIPLKEETDA